MDHQDEGEFTSPERRKKFARTVNFWTKISFLRSPVRGGDHASTTTTNGPCAHGESVHEAVGAELQQLVGFTLREIPQSALIFDEPELCIEVLGHIRFYSVPIEV